METFQSHPEEAGQQGPVQQETQAPAEPSLIALIQHHHPEPTQQEAEVEAQERSC